jgi:hypothetical protein
MSVTVQSVATLFAYLSLNCLFHVVCPLVCFSPFKLLSPVLFLFLSSAQMDTARKSSNGAMNDSLDFKCRRLHILRDPAMRQRHCCGVLLYRSMQHFPVYRTVVLLVAGKSVEQFAVCFACLERWW